MAGPVLVLLMLLMLLAVLAVLVLRVRLAVLVLLDLLDLVTQCDDLSMFACILGPVRPVDPSLAPPGQPPNPP